MPYPAHGSWVMGRSIANNCERFPLESLSDTLRLCQEEMKRRQDGYVPQRSGFVKGYINCDLAIELKLRPVGKSAEYSLVFHRIPVRQRSHADRGGALTTHLLIRVSLIVTQKVRRTVCFLLAILASS